MQQQNIWHIAKYQDPLRNLQPQTCGLIYKFHEESMDIENVGSV